MAFSASCVYTHQTVLVRKEKKRGGALRPSLRPLLWLLIYAIGVITGMVGLGSLVVQNWNIKHVNTITAVFAGCIGGVMVMIAGITFLWKMSDKKETSNRVGGIILQSGLATFMAGMVIIGLLAAFYSDWILGVMTHNLVGAPSSDNEMLYWLYFAAKRLPLLSL